MKLIVGLGNPGDNYEDTRHNIGFMVIEKLAHELGTKSAWSEDKKKKIATARIGEVLLVKPLTYMNASGAAVKSLVDFYKLTAADVWVIHDDLDLPLGKIRIREKGASAGHNGVDSIITHLKTDTFLRFRLGIGRGKNDTKIHTDQHIRHQSVIDFVLSRFTQSEAGDMRKLIKHTVEAVRIALDEGVEKAMNQYN